jgi:hypothetical protein
VPEKETAVTVEEPAEQKKCIDTVQVLEMNIKCTHLETIIANFGRDEKLIAIIIGESRFNPMAVNVNDNQSVDRGIYQLNSNFWKF